MHRDYVRTVQRNQEQESKYILKWVENHRGELVERENLFDCTEDRMTYVRNMLETGRLFDLVEVKELSN